MTLLPQASIAAREVDWLIGSLLAASLAVLGLVLGLMLRYVVRYRESSPLDRGEVGQKTWRVEVAWTAATLVAFFGLFIWGANLFVRLQSTHPDPLTIHVVAKQWMWKVQYPGGQREIDQLHIPANREVQLMMTSEDVIHDFGLPEFRLKHDVLPGRYEPLWINADQPGTYHLFCDQFCGTDHAAMIGTVTVMSPPDYQDWLERSDASAGLLAEGAASFVRYGCSGCHQAGYAAGRSTVRAPSLNGVYGRPVPLSDGSTVLADDRYLHDSILYPGDQVVAGYENRMPSFKGVITEEALVPIIAYIKSLAPSAGPT